MTHNKDKGTSVGFSKNTPESYDGKRFEGNSDEMGQWQEPKYDSTKDTLLHIKEVVRLLNRCAKDILARATNHDNSKLLEPEKSFFDEYTPKLATCTYGSDEYKEFLKQLKIGLDHHYSKNSHHPEHYENGINGMDLFDILEMLMDWKAATQRHNDGNILKSIEINKERFKISDQLESILKNTIQNMGL